MVYGHPVSTVRLHCRGRRANERGVRVSYVSLRHERDPVLLSAALFSLLLASLDAWGGAVLSCTYR